MSGEQKKNKFELKSLSAFLGIIIFRDLLLLFCSSNDKTSQQIYDSPSLFRALALFQPKFLVQLRSFFYFVFIICSFSLFRFHSISRSIVCHHFIFPFLIFGRLNYVHSSAMRWHICFIRFIITCLLDAFAFSMCYSFMSQQFNVLFGRLLYLVPNYFFIRCQQIFTFPFCVCVCVH